MKGASAAQNLPSTTSDKKSKSTEVLQDILYEILTNGPDPAAKVTSADIEKFLHEHARSPKPHGEFIKFFNRHGLSMESEESIDLEEYHFHQKSSPQKLICKNCKSIDYESLIT